nr:MAG TPA: tail tape measure [Caudoviricetes sp.]
MNVTRINSVQLPPRGGMGTGMVGDPNKPYNPELIARQNRQMAGRIRTQSQAQDRKTKAEARQRAAAAARAARIDDVMAQQRIRLSSKYGRDYHSRLGRDGAGQGIQDLNRQFRAGTLSAGQYRQSIQSLERQFRSAQANAGGFGAALGDIRSQLLSAGAAYGVFASGASVLRQGQFFEGMDATMTMVSDSSEEAAKRIQFLKDQAYRLGLDLKIASQGYVQMSVNSDGILNKAQNDELFKGFSEYATALQVDPVKFQRGITAIGQMMGKGQIMAEELKGQLAEGIPGSLQVFVKASQEAFNDTTIDVEKLMDMMQKGELKAAKVLPFVAKYFAEAARNGGALDKALNSNRVAMQQMQQSWINFQNAIFQGGFGEQMTRVFRDLATILSSNGELATNLGNFFGGVIEGFWDMVTEIHDDFVLLDRIVSYYAEKLGYQGDLLKDVFNWAGYAVGMAVFVGGLYKIFGILSKIAGLRGALAAVRGSMGGDLGGGGRGGPAGPNSGPQRGSWGRNRGFKIPAMPGPAPMIAAMLGWNYLNDEERNASAEARNQAMAPARATQSTIQQAVSGDMGLMMKTAFFSLFGSKAEAPSTTIDPNKLVTAGATGAYPGPVLAQQPQKVEGNVTIEIKAGELKNMIRAVVDENNQINFNMLMQGGPN